MRRFIALLLLSAVAACTDSPDTVTAPAPRPGAAAPSALASTPLQALPPFQPGVVVARFRPGSDAAGIAAAQGARVERELLLGMKVLRVAEGRERTVVEALSANPNVERVELSLPRTLGLPCEVADGDCSVPSDNLFGRRWDLHNDGVIRDSQGNVLETVGPVPDADTDWLEAFDQLGAFPGGAVVGLVDTGIYGSHPDLAGRLIAQHDFFDMDDIAEDSIGHGTHVAGIALALADNGIGAAGIAWGPNVKLMVAKGCGSAPFLGYFCWSPDIADGIAWLVDQGANVINLSLGANEDSGFEQDALRYAL
ncbi:MAG TPA: S8 family serine peptidase, partial [Longimicrobiales bacterium]|nr:S8 family serine peptidase [Longimicrobiales bacterium]